MSPNIIVFFTDDHAQWALPGYGNSEIIAPNITALAETGALMLNAFSPCPVCSPARASFWTGLYPSQHGVHDHLAEDDPEVAATPWLEGIPTLAGHLHDAGYSTALCGKWHCGAGETPKSGFDYWYSSWRKTPKYLSMTNKYSDQGQVVERDGYDTRIITDAALDFLRQRDGGKPFFLFIGYATTHNPWINRDERLVARYRNCSFRDIPDDLPYAFGSPGTHPAAPEDPKEALAQYYASVTMIDEAVGRVLDELDAQGESSETLVAYTSDHGLNMGHHGIWGKGNGSEPLNLLEESIRVPLILNCPEMIDSGQRRTEYVDHIDLYATLLDFAGAAPDDNFDQRGRSYAGRLAGEVADKWGNTVFGEYGPVRFARDERYKLVLRDDDGEHLFFDMEADPRENSNLYGFDFCQPIVERMRESITVALQADDRPDRSGLRGDDLPKHNKKEAWRRTPVRRDAH